MWQSFPYLDLSDDIDSFRRWCGKQGNRTSYEILIQSRHSLSSPYIVYHFFFSPITCEKLNITTIRTCNSRIPPYHTYIFGHISFFIHIDIVRLLSDLIFQIIGHLLSRQRINVTTTCSIIPQMRSSLCRIYAESLYTDSKSRITHHSYRLSYILRYIGCIRSPSYGINPVTIT